MPVETDIDQRQAGQRGAHHVQFAGDAQLHLVEAHATHPREMRVGQQQATAIGRTLVPYRHRVAAALKRKVGLARLGHTEGRSRQPRRCTGGRGTGHGFDELPGPTLDQQATGQLDQVQGGDGAQPLGLLALGRQALGSALGQRAVVAQRVAFEQ